MLRTLIISIPGCVLAGLLLFGVKKLEIKEETSFEILADKVGNPAIMTIFRVEPKTQAGKNSDNCQGDGQKLYTPHNEAVFTEAKVGDVLRRYRRITVLRLWDKNIWQDCQNMYMPLKTVLLYPDMNYWPFRKDDLQKSDPDFERISKLTQSQR